MELSAGVLAVQLVIIAIQLGLVVYRLRRIYEVLTAAPPPKEVPPLMAYPFHDDGPHSPFFGNST